MALKHLNMAYEPNCKYFFNVEGNELSLPETEAYQKLTAIDYL